MVPDYLSFQLSDSFVNQYHTLENNVSPFGSSLGEATFYRTYSRSDNPRLPEGSMEKWTDVVRRVIEGMHSLEKDHCLANNINWNEEKATQAAQEAFDLMYHFKWTPPGRGIQFMGTRLIHEEKVVEALQNCSFRSTSVIDTEFGAPFEWLMSMSMLGVGVGFDVLGAGKVMVTLPPTQGAFHWTIPDTREGWAESVRLLVDSYLGNLPHIVFDYSQIRPAGAHIKRFGGTASGPAALVECHTNIVRVLSRNSGSPITSETITDIMNIIGVAVVAGNTRRSAEIALGNPDDYIFTNLKTQENLARRPWAFLSNNSVYATKGMDYTELAKLTYENGEPGYAWMENINNYARMNKVIDTSDHAVGGNPCFEQPLEDYEMCTLADLYLPNISADERRITVKHAYRYAKIVTIANQYIRNPRSREVMMRNRRIGLSQTGVAQYYEQYGPTVLAGTLEEMYGYVQRYDALYSQWYGINRSVRTTSIKPAGTVSLLANSTPGAHFSVAGEYYLRRVNMKAGSPLAIMLSDLGYPVEPSIYSNDTWVVSFPEKLPFAVRSEYEVPIEEQLTVAEILARYWADNNPSVTLKIDRSKVSVEDVVRLLQRAENTLKGVSFLPLDFGIYEQTPFEPLTREEYDKLMEKIPVPFHLTGEVKGLHEIDDRYCSSDGCEIREFIAQVRESINV